MDPQVPQQETPQVEQPSSKKWIYIVGILVLFSVVGVALGYFYFLNIRARSLKTTSLYPNTSAQPTVSPVPQPTTPIEVQNPFSSPTPTSEDQNPFVPPSPTISAAYQNPFDNISQ